MTLSSQTGPIGKQYSRRKQVDRGSRLYFDPDIVSIFFKRIMPYPVGTTVKLSNGLKGIVAENNPNNGLRPRIKIISKQERDCYYIDLYDRSMLNVTIVESLAI